MSVDASVPATERYLLDTSAILALTDQEEGFERVEELLDRAASGRLKAFHHLSFADALIAGAAKLSEAVLVHKDPEFEDLPEEISLLSLPYKRGK